MTLLGGGRLVLLDTDVWSHLNLPGRKPDPRVAQWRLALTGAITAIPAQVRAEVLGGALAKGWSEPRFTRTRQLLDGTPVLYPDERVVQAMAQLFADCRRAGHALHQKEHTADRWVAATAIAAGASLLSADGIYQGAPGLALHPVPAD